MIGANLHVPIKSCAKHLKAANISITCPRKEHLLTVLRFKHQIKQHSDFRWQRAKALT